MSSFFKSIFNFGAKAAWGRIGRWTPDARALGTWTAVALARLKDLAPYALLEILLPGGSVLALTLWFYRRRKRGAAPVGCIARQVSSHSEC